MNSPLSPVLSASAAAQLSDDDDVLTEGEHDSLTPSCPRAATAPNYAVYNSSRQEGGALEESNISLRFPVSFPNQIDHHNCLSLCVPQKS